MKQAKRIILFTGMTIILYLVMTCTNAGWVSNNPDAGPTSGGSGTDISVSGIICEPQGKQRARQACVTLRSRSFLPYVSSLQKRSVVDSAFACSTYTDDTGFYKFDSVPEGAYCIEGRDNNNCMLIDSVAIAIGVHYRPFLDTLKPSAVIRGKVLLDTGSSETYVRVFGLNATAKAKPDGTFSLDNLPQGDLRLQMLVFRHDRQSCDTDMVKIDTKAGDTSVLKFQVTFNSRDGSAVVPQLLNYGDHATEPFAPTFTGCSFAGWFMEPACLNEWQFATESVTRPMTLYAKWTMMDIDGNVYKTVKIGNQVWLAENLKTSKYNDGSAIPLVTDLIAWENLETPGYCWYGNNEAEYKNTYGALYNWYAVNTGKLAPKGWHVSSDAEWDIAGNYVMTQYAWDDSTIGKTIADGSGFWALPAGARDGNNFSGMSYEGNWWLTSELNKSDSGAQQMRWDGIVVYRLQSSKKNGFSVRCIRNE
jgi:uncharacterized protein (TIGR02145 family)